MKTKMYICNSEAEVRHFFEMYSGALNHYAGGLDYAIQKFKINGFIYLFNEDNSSWSQCTRHRQECIDCIGDTKCFDKYEVVEVKYLLRNKKLERICRHTNI